MIMKKWRELYNNHLRFRKHTVDSNKLICDRIKVKILLLMGISKKKKLNPILWQDFLILR